MRRALRAAWRDQRARLPSRSDLVRIVGLSLAGTTAWAIVPATVAWRDDIPAAALVVGAAWFVVADLRR